jgi:hypothetical protein
LVTPLSNFRADAEDVESVVQARADLGRDLAG